MNVCVDDVLDALDAVVDPCSAAMGVPIGLHDMGLVAGVEVSRQEVRVRLRLTSPCCAYGPQLAAAAAAEIARLPGGPAADVVVDHAEMWTPVLVSRSAAEELERRRRRTVELTGVRPHDWSP